ncbi:hypothetical protein [Desulfamplus magnetovallimortis]|uniref:hypothetical protein n=1 Tax=Desulfamplus magnetovallimortis TaxID=1246637 RepID=UPI0009B9A912|nr:hypothetical protein [Desulfamplus magnetovallimortis]
MPENNAHDSVFAWLGVFALPKYFLILFVLKQGYDFGDRKALNRAIRLCCQARLKQYGRLKSSSKTSQLLRELMTEAIADEVAETL